MPLLHRCTLPEIVEEMLGRAEANDHVHRHSTAVEESDTKAIVNKHMSSVHNLESRMLHTRNE